MKPLTTSEQQLIIKLCDLIPEFEELAKDTWPDMFEQKSLVQRLIPHEHEINKRFLDQAIERRKRDNGLSIFFDKKPSDALQYDDEYDV